MRTLGLDLSSRTGVAVWDGESPLPRLEKKRILFWDLDEGKMLEGARLWIGSVLKDNAIQAVAVEAPVMGSHTDLPTIYRQAMLHGMVAWACHRMQIPRYTVQPASWRKTFIGFGKKPKDAPPDFDWKRLAVKRARALGADPPDHNAAEAFATLDFMITKALGIMPPWRGPESADSWLPLPEIGPQQCQMTVQM